MRIDDMQALLERHPFCKDMAPDRVAFLAGCTSNVRYDDGQLVVAHDTAADACWLLRAGRVELRILGKHTVSTIEEGEMFGWSCLLEPYRWTFDAVAVGPVRAIRVDATCLRRKCDQDPSFGFEILLRVLKQAEIGLLQARIHAMDIYGTRRLG